jgi:peptidoglycan/LPS O-acetylase OafA/YrhL
MQKERAYQKHSWIFLAISVSITSLFAAYTISLFFLNFAPSLLTAYQWIAEPVFLAFLIGGLLVVLIPYRRRKRWAWFALLSVPAIWFYFLSITIQGLSGPSDITGQSPLNAVATLVIVLSASLFGLFLPFRRFFPKRIDPVPFD